jgi:hypothetical protein
MSALCSDDYYEDTARQCGVIFTIEAILAKYGVVITGDIDEDVIVVLDLDDLEDMPVGSIQPRTEDAVETDEKSSVEPINEQETIASRVVTPEPQSDIAGEASDDAATTGPTAQSIPAAAEPVDDRTIE